MKVSVRAAVRLPVDDDRKDAIRTALSRALEYFDAEEYEAAELAAHFAAVNLHDAIRNGKWG